MTRITVIGGTGYAGSHIVREAASRGHEVTSVSRALPAERAEGVRYVTGSVLDDGTRVAAASESDVVVATVSPRGDMAGRVAPAYAELAEAARVKGARLGVVGGAGSLLVAEGGPRLVDTDEFPEPFRPEALEFAGILDALRETSEDLDWFYLSPAAGFGAHAPGEATGRYRVGGDVLLTDGEGSSSLSAPDLATALVDEIERPAHRRARFTVAS